MKSRKISEETKAKNRQRDRERYYKNNEFRLKKIEAAKARQNKAKELSDAKAAAKLEAKHNKANGLNNTEMATRLAEMLAKEKAEKIEKQIALENQKIETKERDKAKRRERYASDPEYRQRQIDNSATVKNAAKRKAKKKAVKAERAESRSEENALMDAFSDDTSKRSKIDLAEQPVAEFDMLVVENAALTYLPYEDEALFAGVDELFEHTNIATHQQNLWNSRMQNQQPAVAQELEAPKGPQQ